jgi:hypothetical protein
MPRRVLLLLWVALALLLPREGGPPVTHPVLPREGVSVFAPVAPSACCPGDEADEADDSDPAPDPDDCCDSAACPCAHAVGTALPDRPGPIERAGVEVAAPPRFWADLRPRDRIEAPPLRPPIGRTHARPA